jgi:hypothetical protein
MVYKIKVHINIFDRTSANCCVCVCVCVCVDGGRRLAHSPNLTNILGI